MAGRRRSPDALAALLDAGGAPTVDRARRSGGGRGRGAAARLAGRARSPWAAAFGVPCRRVRPRPRRPARASPAEPTPVLAPAPGGRADPQAAAYARRAGRARHGRGVARRADDLGARHRDRGRQRAARRGVGRPDRRSDARIVAGRGRRAGVGAADRRRAAGAAPRSPPRRRRRPPAAPKPEPTTDASRSSWPSSTRWSGSRR